MGLKTVGTMHWRACETCSHAPVDGGCDIEPEFDYRSDDVECADYLSNEESEERLCRLS